MKYSLTGKWYSASENLFHEATYYATKMKTPFNVSNFFSDFYEVQKKVTGYVMGTLNEWRKLVPKGLGHLMPFIVRRTSSGRIDVGITRNKIFFTPPTQLRLPTREDILKNCKQLGQYQLPEDDTKHLQAIYPVFCFTYLEKFVNLPQIRSIDFFGPEDMILFKNTAYNNMPLTDEPIMNFFIANTEYTKWFKNDCNLFYSTSIVDIPEPLSQCEKLFDRNVLVIKKLVKDIGDLNNLLFNKLFSSSIKEDTKAIFITTNGLNDAKDLLINGKIFQGIGVI